VRQAGPAGSAAQARLTLSRSQEPKHATRPQKPTTDQPALTSPQNPTMDCSHLVSAHPPCSRKGPLLPACGLKCPRRVKRETTNSRFFRFKGTLPNFLVETPKIKATNEWASGRQSKSSLNRVALERQGPPNAPQSALKGDPLGRRGEEATIA
jgi:hypothetical protein